MDEQLNIYIENCVCCSEEELGINMAVVTCRRNATLNDWQLDFLYFFFQGGIKEHITVLHWLFVMVINGQQITLTQDQQCGKLSNVMMYS